MQPVAAREIIRSSRRHSFGRETAFPANRTMKIAVVSSVGGHLSEVLQLRDVLESHQHFYVLNHEKLLPSFMEGKTYFISHSEKDWKFFLNLWELYRIFRREQPDLVLSCGAGPAVPAFLVARLLGIRRIFIETFCAIHRPSLTGRILYSTRLADRFLYQWPALASYYPKGEFGGLIYDPGRRR